MQIRYLTLEHGITSDAPFIGARISAIRCGMLCPGCFNTELHSLPVKTARSKDIIAEVLAHPINEGIILGGLDWGSQSDEMHELVFKAIKSGLKVMIYTGLTYDDFFHRFPLMEDMCLLGQVWLKSGRYIVDLPGYKDKHDVYLASSNQAIDYIGRK